jgi:lipid-A-disaccharide synthase
MRYYLLAGEASGDLHGANLIRALRERDPDAAFRFWGGDRMAAASGEAPVRHIRELSYMGFWEVARHLRTLMRLQREARRDVVAWKPDALVLIDYPGFNLPLAGHARAAGLRPFWYIAPQVWAWKARRVRKLNARVERLYAILPFEPAFFAGRGMAVDFVGHPLLDALPREAPPPDPAFARAAGLPAEGGWLALLPGSRQQELARVLPVMAAVARARPERAFALAAVEHLDDAAYAAAAGPGGLPDNVRLLRGQTQAVLRGARAALVTSGTATLETALLGVPQAVLYRGSAASVWLARRLVHVRYISLPNLVLDRPLLRELIQGEATAEAAGAWLDRLSGEGPERAAVLEGYTELRRRLGGPGASARVAEQLLARLRGEAPPPLPAPVA